MKYRKKGKELNGDNWESHKNNNGKPRPHGNENGNENEMTWKWKVQLPKGIYRPIKEDKFLFCNFTTNLRGEITTVESSKTRQSCFTVTD